LHKLLNGASWRKGAAIDDGTLTICALVKIPDGWLTEKGKIVRKLFEIVAAQDFRLRPEFGPPRHSEIVLYSPFVRQQNSHYTQREMRDDAWLASIFR